jgi:hypothetical protein
VELLLSGEPRPRIVIREALFDGGAAWPHGVDDATAALDMAMPEFDYRDAGDRARGFTLYVKQRDLVVELATAGS